MNTPEKERCKRCGAVMLAASAEKLCPACLLSVALAPGSGDEGAQVEQADFPWDFGGYRLHGLLGSGGMGTVYEAEQIATGRRVALKMLGQQLDSPDVRQRFLREGRLAAGVNHPNSLYIFGSEEIEGSPVITMEIADRGTLKDQLEQQGRFGIKEAVDAILDVITGLEAAYVGGVLHRDIKPSNCFVSLDGSVKVGDFGLSVSTLDNTDTFATAHGRIMGTPAYASPEQLRGDALDVRSDMYSVGATLYTLLTDQAPFEGNNAVQVVANALTKKPTPLPAVRDDLPPGLEQVLDRCMAKEPDERYATYAALRDALLRFSSRVPEPASMKERASAGWIDYIIALLIPYVVMMLFIGGEEVLIRPFVERTLYSARYYLAILGFGCLYFGIAEGIWGAGLGKQRKGLRVVRINGHSPGIGRALVRILIPIFLIEVVRIPLLAFTISDFVNLTGPEVGLLVGITILCAYIPVLVSLTARPQNGFTTLWDWVSGTRVVVKLKGAQRHAIEGVVQPVRLDKHVDSLGPYQIMSAIASGQWISATDPLLHREVWLLQRKGGELSDARKQLGRFSRLRWLQKVETAEAVWDAYDAPRGVPFSQLVEGGNKLPWAQLRHWLHDLATELWEAAADDTLPAELSLDHVWITAQGHAVLLDEPWPEVVNPAKFIPVSDLAGQQRFLNAVAHHVDATHLPLHARSVLQNLKEGTFEKLSFLTGTLRGLLDKPAEVSKEVRAGAIFMLPAYAWVLVFVGYYRGEGRLEAAMWDDAGWIVLATLLLVLGVSALIQLLEVPLATTASHATFRLAVVNAQGEQARARTLLLRWAIVWLPLFVPLAFVALLVQRGEMTTAFAVALGVLLLWVGVAIYAAWHPHQGLHDRLAGTWVVRR